MTSTKEIAKEGLQKSVGYFIGYFVARWALEKLLRRNQKTSH